MKKSLLALAVSLVAVSGANAAWDNGYTGDQLVTNPAGNGEAILLIWDESTKTSYAQDTGVRWDDLVSGAAFNNFSVALDSGALAVFGGNTSNLKWNLGAYSNRIAADETYTVGEFTKSGYIVSTKQSSIPGISDADAQQQTAGFSQLILNLESQLQLDSLAAANGVRTGVNGDSYYAGQTWGGQLTSFLNFSTSGADGEALNLFLQGFADADGNVGLQALLGNATLNLSAGTLVFNGAPTPEVPVPAAAWLMASALAGLGAVGRSRKRS